MTRRLPILVEPENLARVLWPEPFDAAHDARRKANDTGMDPEAAVRHIRIATQAAKNEAAQLLARLDAAGLEIRHKRIRP